MHTTTEPGTGSGSSPRDVWPQRVHVPQERLDDLRERLLRMRWADEVPGAAWDYGVPGARLRAMV